MIIINFFWDWRQLRYLINKLLKSSTVKKIKRLNYVKEYTVDENKNIIKKEQKILIIDYQKENFEKLKKILKKDKLDFSIINKWEFL